MRKTHLLACATVAVTIVLLSVATVSAQAPTNSTQIQPPTNSTIVPPTNSTQIQPPTNSTVSPPTNSTQIQPPTNSTVSPPTNSTQIQPPTNSTVSPPTNSTQIQPPTNSTVSPPTNSTQIQPPTNSTVSPPTNSTIVPPTNSTQIQPPTNSTIVPPTNSTIVPPTNSTQIQPPTNSTIVPPTNSTQIQPPTNSTIVPPTNSTQIQPPTNSTHSVPPTNSTIVPPTNSTIVPPTNSTIVPPTNSTIVPPTNSTIVPPTNSTIVPPTNSTIVPPTNSTIVPPTNSTQIQPPTNSTQIQPPTNSTIVPLETIQFSSITYDAVEGVVRFGTDYDGVLFAPPNGGNATLTDGARSAAMTATNPDCRDPLGACTGNGAAATIGQPARGWFADSQALYVDAPRGILAAGVPGNLTGMTAELNRGSVTVLNPVFIGAAYHTGNGTISIQFSRDVGSVNGSRVAISAGNGTVHPDGNYTMHGGTVHTALSGADRGLLDGVTSLKIRLGEGAVTGAGGHPNAATGDKDITIRDETKPSFVGAAYHTGNGTVSIRFSESLGMVDGSKLVLADGANRVSLSGAAVSRDTVTDTLNQTARNLFAQSSGMSLGIRQGAVADAFGNQIGASLNNTVSVRDTVKPAVSYATYHTDDNTISVQFSEAIVAANDITIDITADNHTISLRGAAVSGDTLTATLKFEDGIQMYGAASLSLAIPAGMVRDMHGNQMDAVSGVPLDIAMAGAARGPCHDTIGRRGEFRSRRLCHHVENHCRQPRHSNPRGRPCRNVYRAMGRRADHHITLGRRRPHVRLGGLLQRYDIRRLCEDKGRQLHQRPKDGRAGPVGEYVLELDGRVVPGRLQHGIQGSRRARPVAGDQHVAYVPRRHRLQR